MAVEELRKKQCARQSHSFQERPLLIACHSRRREISEDLLPCGEGAAVSLCFRKLGKGLECVNLLGLHQ